MCWRRFWVDFFFSTVTQQFCLLFCTASGMDRCKICRYLNAQDIFLKKIHEIEAHQFQTVKQSNKKPSMYVCFSPRFLSRVVSPSSMLLASFYFRSPRVGRRRRRTRTDSFFPEIKKSLLLLLLFARPPLMGGGGERRRGLLLHSPTN